MTVSEFLTQLAERMEQPIKAADRRFLGHECRNYALIALNLEPQEEEKGTDETGDVA